MGREWGSLPEGLQGRLCLPPGHLQGSRSWLSLCRARQVRRWGEGDASLLAHIHLLKGLSSQGRKGPPSLGGGGYLQRER